MFYYVFMVFEVDVVVVKFVYDYYNDWYVKLVFIGCYFDILYILFENEKLDIYDGDLVLINVLLDYLGVNYYICLFVVVCSYDGFSIFFFVVDVLVFVMGWEIFFNVLRDLLL